MKASLASDAKWSDCVASVLVLCGSFWTSSEVNGSMCCNTMFAWWGVAMLVRPCDGGYSWNWRPSKRQTVELCNTPLPCNIRLLVTHVLFTKHLKFTCCCWSPWLYIQSSGFLIRTGENCECIYRRLHRILTWSFWKNTLDSQVKIVVLSTFESTWHIVKLFPLQCSR